MKEISFKSSEFSFTMAIGSEEEILEIDTVSFRGTESSILASKNTERAPVTSITGTYSCPRCPAPLDKSATQTFNFMFTTANGNSAICTQIALGMAIYTGIDTQFSYVAVSSETTCTIVSGDGTPTGVAFNAGGGNVGWIGIPTFDNEASGPNDCSRVIGNWG